MTHKTMLFNKGLQPLALILFLAAPLFAAVPRIMNYQAKLTDSSGVALSGTHPITFYILKNSDPSTDSSGDTLWAETLSVTVTNGLFDVTLGDIHSINLDFSVPYYMELVVDGETMSPREKLAPVSFAYRAIYADTADYSASGGSGVSKNDFRLGPEGTNSRMKGLVSSCNDLPTSGSLSWTLITDNTGGQRYNFCISNNADSASWYEAEAACEDLGGRLCTWGEYKSYYGQTSTSVYHHWTAGLAPGSTNYAEWCTDDPCNTTNHSETYDHYKYRCCVVLE